MPILNSGNTSVTTNPGEYTFVLPGTVITATGASMNTINAGVGGSFDFFNDGTIISIEDDAFNIQIDDFDVSLYNGRNGIIRALDSAVLYWLSTNGTDGYFENHGEISAGDEAFFLSGGVSGDTARILNTGLISGTNHAIETDRATTVTNSGTISSDSEAIDLRANGVHSISNSGLIYGGFRAITAAGPDSTVTIDNSGTIRGDFEAIQTNDGADILRNSGRIEGGVDMVEGDDIVRNSGTIAGDLDLQSGDDLYRGSDQGTVSGDVLGGFGRDTLIGSNGNDSLSGQYSNDLLVGHDGADTLLGASGLDTLFGGPGDDSLDGGSQDDTLNGGAGADEVFGDAGNDILLGRNGDDFLDGGENDDTIDAGAGDDQIEGGDGDDIMRGRAGEDQFKPGLGRDVMTGGEGADVFIFATTAIAGTGADRDVIQDFEQGIDLINVVAMAPGAFDFIGTSGFSGTGVEIRVIETAAGTSIVEFDADGDGTADAQLKVTGVLGLTADDFAL